MVSAIERAWYGKYYAHVLIPLQHPCIEIVIFVEQAAQKSDCRQNEEAAEKSDAYHEPFELIGALAVTLHHGPNVKQRCKTGHQKYCTEHEINAKRQQQKYTQRIRI